MRLTAPQLLKLAPGVAGKAQIYADALNVAMERFGIDTQLRAAHFLAQLVHESGELSTFRENMNYGAAALMRTWPSRFPSMINAQAYERQPQKIANYVYAGRMGNGDVASNDGWNYRGAGWIQLTGKKAQMDCANYFKITSDVPTWLCTPEGAALSAAWFWWKADCNRLADMNNVDAVSDVINIGHRTDKVGDSIGYDKRLSLTRLAFGVLA